MKYHFFHTNKSYNRTLDQNHTKNKIKLIIIIF